MNTPTSSPPTAALPLKPRWIAVACVLLVVYLLLRPWLVERFGLNLPGFMDVKPKADATAQDSPETRGKKSSHKSDQNRPIDVPVIPEQSEPVTGDESVASNSLPIDPPLTSEKTGPDSHSTQPAKPVPPKTESATTANSKPSRPINPGSVAQSTSKTAETPAKSTTPNVPKPNTTRPATPPAKTVPAAEPAKSKLGELKPIGGKRFQSTAGLIYSEYRIEHVLEHSRDNPDKPSHGVYEGTREEIFALIDEAYQIAQKTGPPRVVIEDQGDRTTYTVNMNRKIGHGGGQSGARRRNPPLKMVKIVLEGDEVITAYPTDR